MNLVEKYRGQKYLTLNICGLIRELPIQNIDNELWIASNHKLVLGRDIEFTQRVGTELASRLIKYKPEYLLTAEAKSLVLVYETCKQLGLEEMLVARKGLKVYMKNYIEQDVISITTREIQKLIFEYDKDKKDLEKLKGKRVAIVDDVITTHGTMAALGELVSKFHGKVVCKAAVWLEGPWSIGKGVTYLDTLPVFATGKKYDELKHLERKTILKTS